MSVDTDLSDSVEGGTQLVETPAPHRSLEEQIEEVLRGSASPPDASQETGPADASPEAVEIPDLKTAAERLQVDPAKLYDLKVPLSDGTETTLGALKDAYKPVAELTKAREAFSEEQVKWRTDQETATRELSSLLSLLDPKVLSPQFLQEAARQTERARQQMADKLLELIPDWKDPVTKAAEWQDLKATAREYGFTDADVALAQQGFADPRFLKMARDLAKAQAKAKGEAVKPAPKVAAKPQGKGTTPTEAQQFGRLKAAVTKGQISRGAAIESILKGAKVI